MPENWGQLALRDLRWHGAGRLRLGLRWLRRCLSATGPFSGLHCRRVMLLLFCHLLLLGRLACLLSVALRLRRCHVALLLFGRMLLLRRLTCLLGVVLCLRCLRGALLLFRRRCFCAASRACWASRCACAACASRCCCSAARCCCAASRACWASRCACAASAARCCCSAPLCNTSRSCCSFSAWLCNDVRSATPAPSPPVGAATAAPVPRVVHASRWSHRQVAKMVPPDPEWPARRRGDEVSLGGEGGDAAWFWLGET